VFKLHNSGKIDLQLVPFNIKTTAGTINLFHPRQNEILEAAEQLYKLMHDKAGDMPNFGDLLD
jgi:hypothetical protein